MILRATLAGATLLFAGCSTTITNMTSETMPENPSQIYTITAKVKPREANYVKGSVNPQIVINGQIHPMQPSAFGGDVYEYDFAMPPGVTEASYYLLVNYRVENNGVSALREEYTPLYRIRLTNRYVFTMEATRGPVGARIGVVGRGFTPQDVVYFENSPARTVYESPNSIAFFVPAVAAAGNFRVSLQSPAGNSPIGTFRVDPMAVSVSPMQVALVTGGRSSLLFSIPSPAPVGGLLIDVTTDIPQSVIMPEVIVPAGATSVSVTLQGGRPGTGHLYVTSPGAGETRIPVTVRAR